MADQETLTGAPTFDPRDHGVFRRFIDGEGRIVEGAWRRACAEGAFVGECRRCGDYLVPRHPEHVSKQRTDFEATCRNIDGCGWVMNAPNGIVLRRSSRKHERPGK